MCSANNGTVCCKQMISSSTFKCQQTNKSYAMFHEVNCSSAYVTHLMECTLCKMQYLGKSDTSFTIRLNNHRKDDKKPDAILACRHFQQNNHVFIKHAKFIITDKLTNATKSKDVLRQILIERENFWIQTLETLHPKGLNQELST